MTQNWFAKLTLAISALCILSSCASTGAALAPGRPADARQATIYRDNWGVPHIYAQSEAAAFYALGYAQAEDRPERTLFLFAFARGEVAQSQGAQALPLDLRNRLWRHRDMGARGVERLSPELRLNYEAYLAGLRAYFTANPERRPSFYFEPDLTDVLALERAAFFFGYQSMQGMADCQAASPVPPAPGADLPGSASNGWAVAPQRTADNAVIVASDPHVAQSSAFYYEYRIDAGTLKSAGYAMGPFLWQAHNRDVAWAMTTGGPDIVDCYEVEVDPANPSRYQFDGEWREFIVHNERFETSDAGMIERTFEYTMHNGVLSPVIDRRNGRVYVASAVAMDHAGRFGAEILAMNRARNIQDVREAMQGLGMFQQNLIIGDSNGDIMYVRAGAAAVRSSGYDWTRPVPGNTSQTAWRGLRPLSELVQSVNPDAGYIQNNNVAPDTINRETAVQASDYAADVFNDEPGRTNSRGIRATAVLHDNARMTWNDAIALAMDETWVTAQDWAAALDYAAQGHGDYVAARSNAYRIVLDRLRRFDGVGAAGSEAAAEFLIFRQGTADILQRDAFSAFRQWPWDRTAFTPDFGLALLEHLDGAVTRMQNDFGGVDVALGDLYYAGRSAPGWPVGGVSIFGGGPCLSPVYCEQTLRAFNAAPPSPDGPTPTLSGSQAMRLVSFTEPLRSYSLYAFGQSDDPDSPHYQDQARLFSERRMKPTYFEFDDLRGHIESQTTLTAPLNPGDHHAR